jgi:hypothetical protein
MADEGEIGLQRLALDRERLELERQRALREGGIVNRYLGAILTSGVSIIALLTTFILGMETQEQKARELDTAASEAERQWRIKAADFIATNNASIFSADARVRQTFQGIVKVAFPKEISDEIQTQVQEVTATDIAVYAPRGDTDTLINALRGESGFRARLQAWVQKNAPDKSITEMLYSAEDAELRDRAIKELGVK